MSRALPLLIALGVGLCPALIGAPLALLTAHAAACSNDVIVLGADLSPARRADVLTRLGAPDAAYLNESLADERAEAGDLIPPYLLGMVAVSSARLTRRPAGAGLTVRTDPTVTFDTAAMYANALLTAGVRDASVQVTALRGAPALGTTALLGLLRAARAACIDVSPERGRLAVRELVLTTKVANAYGVGPAASLVQDAKRAAIAQGATDTTTLSALTQDVTARTGTPLHADTRATLTGLLADLLAASRRYPDLASPAQVRAASPYLAGVAGIAPQPTRIAPQPTATAYPPTAKPSSQPLRGVAIGAAQGTLVGTFAGDRRTLGHVVGGLVVTRNGVPAHMDDVRPGDMVSVWTDGSGRMVRLSARGPAAARSVPTTLAPPTVQRGVITASGPTTATYSLTTPLVVAAAPDLVVTRNGRPATLADLTAGDAITVTRNPTGQVVRVDARSFTPPAIVVALPTHPTTRHGTVRAAAPDSLTYTDSATGRNRTLHGPFGPLVTRNRQSGLGVETLRPGDGLTVFLDGQGRVRAIEALSHGSPPRAATADNWPLLALGALAAIGLLLLLLLLLLRALAGGRRGLPFALIKRQPGEDDDAAPPASIELARDARVMCTDGEAGRLAHVVVAPETGAVLRLVPRDSSKKLRDVPGHLLEAVGPREVRLSVSRAELEDQLEGQPAFAPRRYSPLVVDEHRSPGDGVRMDVTADTLRIEITGPPTS